MQWDPSLCITYFPNIQTCISAWNAWGHRVFADIDFAAYGKHRSKLVPFLESQGYELEKRAAMISGGTRLIFFSSNIPMIDVFFDKLDYNHVIDFHGRSGESPCCASLLADLLLQKLQIVEINDKDLKDAMLLLLVAAFSDTDQDFNQRLITLLEYLQRIGAFTILPRIISGRSKQPQEM